jgi:hypothetical protein
MLGKISIVKVMISLLSIGAVIGTLTGGYLHYKSVVNARDIALQNAADLQSAVDTNEQTITSLQEDIDQSREIRTQVELELAQAQARTRRLERILQEHDLGLLAEGRPGMVENIINQGTQDANRCLEILSGSPLTQQELDARLPSEVNSSCPELANPNRRDQ